MAKNNVKEVLREISDAAESRGVPFGLHRKGRNHLIYHLGSSVTLPIPHSTIPSRIKEEMYRNCEAELGYRWWMPADRRPTTPVNLPVEVPRGHRGPRGRAVRA